MQRYEQIEIQVKFFIFITQNARYLTISIFFKHFDINIFQYVDFLKKINIIQDFILLNDEIPKIGCTKLISEFYRHFIQ